MGNLKSEFRGSQNFRFHLPRLDTSQVSNHGDSRCEPNLETIWHIAGLLRIALGRAAMATSFYGLIDSQQVAGGVVRQTIISFRPNEMIRKSYYRPVTATDTRSFYHWM